MRRWRSNNSSSPKSITSISRRRASNAGRSWASVQHQLQRWSKQTMRPALRDQLLKLLRECRDVGSLSLAYQRGNAILRHTTERQSTGQRLIDRHTKRIHICPTIRFALKHLRRLYCENDGTNEQQLPCKDMCHRGQQRLRMWPPVSALLQTQSQSASHDRVLSA
jgi:hypothetical protein